MNAHNEEYRFGSARWADEVELRHAGLLGQTGPQVGYWNRTLMCFESDAPMITIGGAGSGKTRDLLAYVVCNSPGQRMAVIDPRGELSAISMVAHAMHGEYVYNWNPMGIAGLPGLSCNPLDILDQNSPNFHADCKFIAESLIPLSGSSGGHYFELRGREWLEGLLKHAVELRGCVTLINLVEIINSIETDTNIWADWLTSMLASKFDSVRRAAGEMLTKQQDSPKEFGSILGELYAHTGFLNDPALQQSLTGDGFSLSTLTDRERVAKLFFNVPAEYLSLWSPLLRLFFTVIMLYKSRQPDAPRVLLLVDEAGQLGRFEALLRAFTFGRGAGIRAWAIFQDTGQIVRNFDRSALSGFLGSAQFRQFFGVRDYETAQLVSNMLGQETLPFNDDVKQSDARLRQGKIISSVLDGHDPFQAAAEYQHLQRTASHRSKQQRALVTPDEVLAMPEDKQILFIAGKNLPPIYANKYPYFSRIASRVMQGKYLPNPYHPPVDKIKVPTWYGGKWVRVITEPVPEVFADHPQYRSGQWSYLAGYKPVI